MWLSGGGLPNAVTATANPYFPTTRVANKHFPIP
jgi:hypothetical protein